MPIEMNILESTRFGVVAARVVDAKASPEAIDTASRVEGVQMLTVRIDTSDLPRVHAFETAGYRLMDTLVYYGRALTNLLPRSALPDGITCRVATPGDAGGVADVARAGFTGYMGHYHADPRLDDAAADAAYVEWAETSTVRNSSQAPVLVAESNDRILGFLTLRRNSPDEAEIVLNAVHPVSQRRGIYGALVAEGLQLARSLGGTRVVASTQINNATVQRVWIRHDFLPIRSVYTFHKWI